MNTGPRGNGASRAGSTDTGLQQDRSRSYDVDGVDNEPGDTEMKKQAMISVIALTCGTAFAAPHGYQLQVGSSELDPHIWEGPALEQRTVKSASFVDSRTALYEQADVDGDGPFHRTREVVPSGPSRISLYEVQRGSSEGIANQGYFDRFPADTDWDAIAAKYKSREGDV
jgi:hypothetical protein